MFHISFLAEKHGGIKYKWADNYVMATQLCRPINQ